MKRFAVELEGVVPNLFNRFTEKAQEGLDRPGSRKLNQSERIEEAYTKVYRRDNSDPEGEIGIPADNIKKSMLIGAQFAGLKIGRRSAMPFMRAVVHLEDTFAGFGVSKPGGIHECAGNIPPGPKGSKAIIRRPFLEVGWKLGFSLYIADERVIPEMVEIALKEAGLLGGLCDHRPEYGRFQVNSFKEIK